MENVLKRLQLINRLQTKLKKNFILLIYIYI
jgi:hypothetical protein